MPIPSRLSRKLAGLTAALALALAPACGAAAPPAAEAAGADRLRRAVARTVEEGSARVLARVRSTDTGSVVLVEGVTSLVGPQAWARASVEGAPELGVSEVRVTGAGSWLRPPGSKEWMAVDPGLADASPAASWGGLLRELAEATDVSADGSRLTAMAGGATVTVVLDGQGRVTRVHQRGEGTEISLELSDFGVRVEVEPP